jgi:hypothetical protein
MSGGYTPVFSSIFTGTLFGKYPDLPLWLVLLAMADKNGVIDAHPSYISAACGIDQADVAACIERFCLPDPASRTPDDDGRRLVPLEGRGFGWRIVNHGKYREKARKAMHQIEATASGRDAERKRLARDRGMSGRVQTSPAVSGAGRLSDSDADTDTEKKPHGPARDAQARAAFDAEFSRLRADYPRRAGSHRWPDAMKHVRARLKEGHTWEELRNGTRRYAAFIEATGKAGTDKVQQAATFFGTNKGFAEAWEAPAPSAPARRLTKFEQLTAGLALEAGGEAA